jgi:hypothetical protein
MTFQGFDLVWYGDSITYELYQGSDRQQEWAHYFGQYRSAVFGLPSEGIEGIRNCLINGQAPKARCLPITCHLEKLSLASSGLLRAQHAVGTHSK